MPIKTDHFLNRSRHAPTNAALQFRQNLVGTIKAWRESRGRSVVSVADAIAGCDGSQIRKIEAGKVNMTIERLRQITDALDLRVALVEPDGTVHVIE